MGNTVVVIEHNIDVIVRRIGLSTWVRKAERPEAMSLPKEHQRASRGSPGLLRESS